MIERTFADSRGYGTEYVCMWCLAEVLAITSEPRQRRPYRPVGERWPAGSRKNNSQIEHAVISRAVTGRTLATLCGVEDARIMVYRHHWRPTSSKACPDCVDAANEVDARWPPDRRDLA